MPPVHSKFHSQTLPTFEKVYRWYEGLSSNAGSSDDEPGPSPIREGQELESVREKTRCTPQKKYLLAQVFFGLSTAPVSFCQQMGKVQGYYLDDLDPVTGTFPTFL